MELVFHLPGGRNCWVVIGLRVFALGCFVPWISGWRIRGVEARAMMEVEMTCEFCDCCLVFSFFSRCRESYVSTKAHATHLKPCFFLWARFFLLLLILSVYGLTIIKLSSFSLSPESTNQVQYSLSLSLFLPPLVPFPKIKNARPSCKTCSCKITSL